MATEEKRVRHKPMAGTCSLLVDGNTLRWIELKLGWEIDIERLVKLLRETHRLPRLVHFETEQRGGELGQSQASRHRWLEYRGFEIVMREALSTGEPGGTDSSISPITVEIACEAMSAQARCDQVFLLTRDRSLEAIGRRLRRCHRILTLISDADCPSDLRRSATYFLELNTMRDALERQTSRKRETRR
jgi:uncharacterized LabA/DUF88 family protein